MWLLPCACCYAICAASDLRKSACLPRLSDKLSAQTRELSKVLQLRRPFGQHLTTAGSNQTTGTNQSACGLLTTAGPGPALSLVGAVCASTNAYSALHQLSFSSCIAEPEPQHGILCSLSSSQCRPAACSHRRWHSKRLSPASRDTCLAAGERNGAPSQRLRDVAGPGGTPQPGLVRHRRARTRMKALTRLGLGSAAPVRSRVSSPMTRSKHRHGGSWLRSPGARLRGKARARTGMHSASAPPLTAYILASDPQPLPYTQQLLAAAHRGQLDPRAMLGSPRDSGLRKLNLTRGHLRQQTQAGSSAQGLPQPHWP